MKGFRFNRPTVSNPNRAQSFTAVWLVYSHPELKLHRLVTQLNGHLLGVLAHVRGHAFAPCLGGNHVAAVANMAARTGIVGFDVVGAQNLSPSSSAT